MIGDEIEAGDLLLLTKYRSGKAFKPYTRGPKEIWVRKKVKYKGKWKLLYILTDPSIPEKFSRGHILAENVQYVRNLALTREMERLANI